MFQNCRRRDFSSPSGVRLSQNRGREDGQGRRTRESHSEATYPENTKGGEKGQASAQPRPERGGASERRRVCEGNERGGRREGDAGGLGNHVRDENVGCLRAAQRCYWRGLRAPKVELVPLVDVVGL